MPTRESSNRTFYDAGDRTRLWVLFGAFGVALAITLENLLARVGIAPFLGWLVGPLAALSLGVIAEIGMSIRNKLEEQFPSERWTEALLRGDS